MGEFPASLTSSAFSIVATRLLLTLRELNSRRPGNWTRNVSTTEHVDGAIEFKIRKVGSANNYASTSTDPTAYTLSTDGDSTVRSLTLFTK